MKFRGIGLAHLLFLGFTATMITGPAQAVEDFELDWGLIKDPRIRETLYDLYDQSYFSGIVRLVTNRNYIDMGAEKDLGKLLLSALYLGYGMPDRTQEILLDFSDRGVESELQNRLWYYLAKYYYQQGNLTEAATSLQQVHGALEGDLENERLTLRAELLSKESKFKEAARVLRAINGDSARAVFGRYNLGILLLRSDSTEAGIRTLNEVAQIKSLDPSIIALVEQANLSLGSHYLRVNAPNEAKKPLLQIRLDSPLAPKALLGMGWSYAAAENYNSALVAWSELLKYSVADPAVLEGYLASGYAYSKLLAVSQALDQYEKSSVIMKTELRRVDSIIQSVYEGTMMDLVVNQEPLSESGWFGEMTSIPEIPAKSYLVNFFASHEFQEAYKDYRDLRYLSDQLQDWTHSMEKYSGMSITFRESYLNRIVTQQTKISSLQEKSRAFMQQITVDHLLGQKELINNNLKQARFQMAQILDQAGREMQGE